MSKLDRRFLLLAGASAVALAACSNIVGPPEPPPLYVLRPPVPPAGGGARVGWQLSVVVPEAPDSLDTNRIVLQHPNQTMDYYADAEWPDRLSLLVQSALLDAFGATNRIAAVGRDTDGLKSDYLLETDIRDFEAIYETEDTAPSVVVRIDAKIVNAHTRAIVKSFNARSEVDAGANTVPSVVTAMNQALGEVMDKIVGWALTTPDPVKA